MYNWLILHKTWSKADINLHKTQHLTWKTNCVKFYDAWLGQFVHKSCNFATINNCEKLYCM